MMRLGVLCLACLLLPPVSFAGPVFFFSTGNPDGRMATASRPDIGAFEIESADDFILNSETRIDSATFHGLLTGGAMFSDVGDVVVEIYRVFPLDSDTGRTSGPPVFSTPNVPTRVNSPSDVAFDSRDLGAGTLSVTLSELTASFTASNSVQPGGIHPKPGQTTGGDGPVTGVEVLFSIVFNAPLLLPPGHYFFVPQVQTSVGNFLWLSTPRPIVPPGTAFPPGTTDLQSWTRDEALDPDWLRVGTDIVGGTPAPTFNAAFSLSGEAVPEPSSGLLAGVALLTLCGLRRAARRAS